MLLQGLEENLGDSIEAARHTAKPRCYQSLSVACSYIQSCYCRRMLTTSSAVQEDVARPTADTVQITFRIPTSWVAEAEALAKRLSRPGIETSKTDAFRAAIARGFEAFRADAGTPPPAPASRPREKSAKKR